LINTCKIISCQLKNWKQKKIISAKSTFSSINRYRKPVKISSLQTLLKMQMS
jgi:hypothetical protein